MIAFSLIVTSIRNFLFFQDSCGLSPRSNLKQCIRMLSKRVLDLDDVSLTVDVDEEVCFRNLYEYPLFNRSLILIH